MPPSKTEDNVPNTVISLVNTGKIHHYLVEKLDHHQYRLQSSSVIYSSVPEMIEKLHNHHEALPSRLTRHVISKTYKNGYGTSPEPEEDGHEISETDEQSLIAK